MRLRSSSDSMSESILDELEAIDLGLGEIVVERVTVVEFRMDYGSGTSGGSFEVTKGTDAAYVADVVKTVKREGRDLWDERMVGVKQETKVTNGRRGEDLGRGEKEGRVGDFRELDRSANKHEFSLGWVKREKVRRQPFGNVREEITEIVGCIFEGISEEGEKDM
jgi:hypothetical protein